MWFAVAKAVEKQPAKVEKLYPLEAAAKAQEELLFAKREQEQTLERETAELQANLETMRTEFNEELAQQQAD